MLLRGKPTTLDQAIKETGEIEYALNFENREAKHEVNLVPQKKEPTEFEKLQENLDRMSKHLEELEISLNKKDRNSPNRFRSSRSSGGRSYGRNSRQPATQACWLCGEIGHFSMQLSFKLQWASPDGGGWPRP